MVVSSGATTIPIPGELIMTNLILLIFCATPINLADELPAANAAALASFIQALELSDTQKEQVTPVLRRGAVQRWALMKTYQDKHGDKRNIKALRRLQKDMSAIQKQTEKELKPILTRSQMKRYEKLVDERKQDVRKQLLNP